MLDWKSKKTEILSWENTRFEKFSENVINSNGFIQKSPEEINIPEILEPCINRWMPIYEKMYEYRLIV